MTLGGELIGNNYAVDISTQYAYMHNIPLIAECNIYGGENDLWGTDLTSANLLDPTFGAVLSFQSNEMLPHRDLAYINQIAIQVNYQ